MVTATVAFSKPGDLKIKLSPCRVQNGKRCWNCGRLSWTPMEESPWRNHGRFLVNKSYPICSMYGIFTYITGWFLGQMSVNIPYMEHMGTLKQKILHFKKWNTAQKTKNGFYISKMCGKHGNICAHRTSAMLWMPDQITLKTSPNHKFQKETARLYLQDRVSIRNTREGRAVFFSSSNKRLTWPKGSKPCVQFWLNGQWYSPLYGHNLPQNPTKSATSWTSQGVEPVEHIFQHLHLSTDLVVLEWICFRNHHHPL